MARVDDPQNVESNLRVLASLPSQKAGAKVNYDASTGRLSIGNWALFRSDSDSVTSPEFSDRMKALFRKAYRDRGKYSTLCETALVGLQWLQKNSYAKEPTKLKSLQKVLDELAILKREADRRGDLAYPGSATYPGPSAGRHGHAGPGSREVLSGGF